MKMSPSRQADVIITLPYKSTSLSNVLKSQIASFQDVTVPISLNRLQLILDLGRLQKL